MWSVVKLRFPVLDMEPAHHRIDRLWVSSFFCRFRVCLKLWSPCIICTPYRLEVVWRNFKLCHHSICIFTCKISIWWIYYFWLLCYSARPILFHCSRIVQLAHPLQSVDWLGIEQYHFLSAVTWPVISDPDVVCMGSQAPFAETFCFHRNPESIRLCSLLVF